MEKFICKFPIKENPLTNYLDYNKVGHEVWLISGLTKEQFLKVDTVQYFTRFVFPRCSDLTRYLYLDRITIVYTLLDDHTDCEWGDVAMDPTKCKIIWGQVEQCLDKLADRQLDIPINTFKPYIIYFYETLMEMCSKLNQDQILRLVKVWKEMKEYCLLELQLMADNDPRLNDIDFYLKVTRPNRTLLQCKFPAKFDCNFLTNSISILKIDIVRGEQGYFEYDVDNEQ